MAAEGLAVEPVTSTTKKHGPPGLFLLQLQQKMVFFAYSCSNFSKKACYSLLILVPATAKEHGLLYLFLFQL